MHEEGKGKLLLAFFYPSFVTSKIFLSVKHVGSGEGCGMCCGKLMKRKKCVMRFYDGGN